MHSWRVSGSVFRRLCTLRLFAWRRLRAYSFRDEYQTLVTKYEKTYSHNNSCKKPHKWLYCGSHFWWPCSLAKNPRVGTSLGIFCCSSKYNMYSNNAPSHKDGDRCPCCSSERDTGGRLRLEVTRKANSRGHLRFWLKCPKCKYAVNSNSTQENKSVKHDQRFEYLKKIRQARKAQE